MANDAQGDAVPQKWKQPMPLSSIILRLARNPGSDHPEPDPHNGYALIAPLTDEGHLDEAEFGHSAARCRVRRFMPDTEPRLGRLVRHGGRWAIHYGDEADVRDETVYRLHDHRFILGAYVSIMDDEGALMTYRVTDVAQARNAAA
jgi:hypothetical protein